MARLYMKAGASVLAAALFFAAIVNGSAFSSCSEIDQSTYEAAVAGGAAPVVGPNGPVITNKDGTCSVLNILAPGFKDANPEYYAQYVNIIQGVADQAAADGHPEASDAMMSPFDNKSVVKVLEGDATPGCGQVCDSTDRNGCLFPCTCRYDSYQCVDTGLDLDCIYIYKCQG